MERSTELRIPTTAVAVRMLIGERAPAEVELFVADEPGRGHGKLLEDLADMLDEGAAFVPVRDARGVRLVAKDAIAWIGIRTDPASEDEVFTLYDRQHRVEIELASGTLVGLLLDSSPADRPRVIDYLNRVPRFVRLVTPQEQLLVNKSRILGVVELPPESTEQPEPEMK